MSSTLSSEQEVKSALKRCGGSFLMTAFFSFFINILVLAGPLYMLLVYDRVLTSGSLSTLTALSILVALLLVLMGGLEFVRSRILVRIGRRIDQRLHDRVFDALMRRSLLPGQGTNDRPLRDLASLREFLSGPGPTTFFDAPWVPIFILAIFLLHPVLGYVAMGGAVLLFAVALANEFLTRKPLGESGLHQTEALGLANAGQRNAEVLASMGMMSGLRARWGWYHAYAQQAQVKASDRAGSLTAVSKTLRLVLQSAILGAGAALAIDQIISPGAMIAASIIMGRALAPVEQAIGQWRNFVAARGAYSRLGQLLQENPEEPSWVRLPQPQGRVSVERVFAGPPAAKRPLLTDINFALEPGEALGVIGPSSSGKSTLARLLAGVWSAQHGAIRLDGALLSQWDRKRLGNHIGYLPQDVELFNGSVRDNICRFSEEPDDEAVVEAALQAGVHHMILQLSEGYNTIIGEGGSRLSGGQRQRIALARALYKNPVLVVLDEPNSNLDAEGEMALTRAVRDMRTRGQTVVIVAHRPSAIAAVDKLLMLENGAVRAYGSKDDVLKSVAANINKSGDKVAALTAKQAS